MTFCKDCPHDGRCLDSCLRLRDDGQHFTIEWKDAERDAVCKPDPKYPDGVDLDVTRGKPLACKAFVPYPAKRVGAYVVTCKACGFRAGLTTAGRVDDPRSIKIPCKIAGQDRGQFQFDVISTRAKS